MKRARSPEAGGTQGENINSDSDESDSEAYTLEELGELYDSADAVLGGSDPDNCSWTKGYVKRQALYACLTCRGEDTKKQAGVCLACSNKCHENHQLVELYTKRDFRCDCGNTKFDTPCLLQPEKDAVNDGNLYNQNFDGVYCTCKRPYPDSENPDSDDEMAQCVICEDWFHGKHSLGQKWSSIASADGVESEYELICTSCVSSCDFLHHYDHLTVKWTIDADHKEKSTEDEKSTEVEVEGEKQLENPSLSEDEKTNKLKAEIDVESRSGSPTAKKYVFCTSATNEVLSGCTSQETVDSGIMSDGSQEKSSEQSSTGTKNDCLLKLNAKVTFPRGAILMESGWRTKLCECESCLNLYYKLGVSFIRDDNDTLRAYEAIGKEKMEEEEKEKEEALTNLWSRLDHVGQIEAMIGINEMKEQLKEFMLKHDGGVIRRRDVEAFFSDLRAKRPRYGAGDGIPPSNCR